MAEGLKLDLVVHQLGRFGIEAAGLQETKWFGKGVYPVADSLILVSGRPSPSNSPASSGQRGEGVALVLRHRVRYAFEFGGCQWTAVSSRILVARLKFVLHDSRVLWFSVGVCYAPTFCSSRERKDEFANTLQNVLLSVDEHDHLIVLGDFNAHIGSLYENSVWYGVRGPHGVSSINDAG